MRPGALVFRAMNRVRRTRAMDLYRETADLPHLDRDSVRDFQFTRLSELLRHAEGKVPYYRELFRSLGITSRDIRSFSDFAALPILTKDIVRQRKQDLVRDDVPLNSLLAHHSGGSTGVPLSFYRDRDYLDVSTAGTWRNLSQAGWRPGDMIGFFWGWNDTLNRMPRWQFELRQWARRMYQFDPFKSGPAEMDRWASTWQRIRPRVALGYASTIARFAQYLESTGRQVRSVSGVFTTAEKLYPAQREVISRVFGCKVYDCYGSSEVQNIGAECSAGSMHVQADHVVLEVGDGGETGSKPLLATSLHNYAMPFIRYRNEDCGTLISGECSCGSGFPLMELNVARVSDNFVLPCGRVVHGEYFTHLMYGAQGISTFQFHQVDVGRIILRVVPEGGGGEVAAGHVRHAVNEVVALDPGRITVDVEMVDTISLSSAGKHRFTRSDVRQEVDSA